ncbi:glycosyltransferasee [Candidatus Hepatincola sp. Pdp]
MINNIKISVIIPAYNSEITLNKCLNSVRQQTLSDIEILCIDDRSKDKTPHILLKHSQFDLRVKVITLKKNIGLGAVRNLGLQTAQGEYICFLDSDDFFNELTALEQLYKIALPQHLDIIIFSYKKLYTKTHLTISNSHFKNLLPHKIYSTTDDKEKILLNSSIGIAWNKMYKRELIINNNITFAEKILYEDVLFFFKSIILAKDIQVVDKDFITYTKSSNTIMKIKNINNIDIIIVYNLVVNFLKTNNLYETFEYAFIYKSFGAFFRMLKTIPWVYKQQYLEELHKHIKDINLLKYKDRLGERFPKYYKLQNINSHNKLSLLLFILFS